MAGEDLYIRLNDREDFWAELEALLELPEGCDLVMLDNTIRMFVTICGAYHGECAGVVRQKWVVARPLRTACGGIVEDSCSAVSAHADNQTDTSGISTR